MTCTAHEVETGLELRFGYDNDDAVRTELFRGARAEERLAAKADEWRQALLVKGFTEATT